MVVQKKTESGADAKLGRVLMHYSGPKATPTLGGNCYVVVLVDDCTTITCRYCRVSSVLLFFSILYNCESLSKHERARNGTTSAFTGGVCGPAF